MQAATLATHPAFLPAATPSVCPPPGAAGFRYGFRRRPVSDGGVWRRRRLARASVDEEEETGGVGGTIKTRTGLQTAFSGNLWTGAGAGLLTGITVVLFSSSVRLLQEIFAVSPEGDLESQYPFLFSMLRNGYTLQQLPVDQRRFLAPVLGALISTCVLLISRAIQNQPYIDIYYESQISKAKNTNATKATPPSPTQKGGTPRKRGRGTKKEGRGILTGNVWREAISSPAKIAASAVVLGSGNSLGPEGPSVEIGKGWGKVLSQSPQTRNALVAAGMAAGVSAGFNAPVTGVLFALETTFFSAQSDARDNQNALVGVVVAAVVAAVASRVGLGDAPPLFAIPQIQLGSYFELPLYVFLGFLCGAASLSFTRLTEALSRLSIAAENSGIPGNFLPILASIGLGITTMQYPEVMYQGFVNFDRMLEAPEASTYSASLLMQIALAKVAMTALARAFGLQGGIYAPSLFVGAVLGLAFGTFIRPILEGFVVDPSVLSAPQAYAIAGMAATLGGICRIPLTASLLLFEITRDYGIILPILVAVAASFSQVTAGEPGIDLEDYKKKTIPRTANPSPRDSQRADSLGEEEATPETNYASGSPDIDGDTVKAVNVRNPGIADAGGGFSIAESRDWWEVASLLREDQRKVAILYDSPDAPGSVSALLAQLDTHLDDYDPENLPGDLFHDADDNLDNGSSSSIPSSPSPTLTSPSRASAPASSTPASTAAATAAAILECDAGGSRIKLVSVRRRTMRGGKDGTAVRSVDDGE